MFRLSNCGDSTGRATALPYRNGTPCVPAMIDPLNLVLSGVTIQPSLDLPRSTVLRFNLNLSLWLRGDPNLRQTQKSEEANQTSLQDDKVDADRQWNAEIEANQKHAQSRNEAVHDFNTSCFGLLVHLNAPRRRSPPRGSFVA